MGGVTTDRPVQEQLDELKAALKLNTTSGGGALTSGSTDGKQHFHVTGDFNTPTNDVGKFEGREFKDGNFEMPAGLLKAAQENARDIIASAKKSGVDLSQTAEFGAAAQLTKDHKIDQDSLAAYLLAKSMGNGTDGTVNGMFGPSHLTARFENKLDTHETQTADPKLVFEMARQIMGDNGMGNKIVGGATDTPEADKQFVGENAGRAAHSFTAKC